MSYNFDEHSDTDGQGYVHDAV